MLHEEEKIKSEIERKFPELADKVIIKRARSMFVQVPYEKFRAVFDLATQVLGFNMLYTITGLDLRDSFAAIYHLGRKGSITLNIETSVSHEAPVINTISDRFPAGDIYERELVDLLGFKVVGLPAGNRYPLPDNWGDNGHPLRKDWKQPEAKSDAQKEAK